MVSMTEQALEILKASIAPRAPKPLTTAKERELIGSDLSVEHIGKVLMQTRGIKLGATELAWIRAELG